MPPHSIDYATAFVQGEQAHKEGLHMLSANPYDAVTESQAFAGWQHGWLAACGTPLAVQHTPEDVMLPPKLLHEDDGYAD